MEDFSNEIWKPIVDYEGLYEVSSLGRVRSVDRVVRGNYGHPQSKKGTILKGRVDKDGYIDIVLSKNCKTKHFRAHRLVAIAFIPNPSNKEQVNHINECPSDNRVDNLEWVTCKENINYGTRSSKMAGTRVQRGILSKPVIQIDAATKQVIAEYRSIHEAERETGAKHSNISRCCYGKQKLAKGFLWKFK